MRPTRSLAPPPGPGARSAQSLGALVLLVGACISTGHLVEASKESPAATAGELSLITEPGQGMSAIYNLITSAKHWLDMTMYELNDTTAEGDLAADAARGVKVRVVLDGNLAQSYNTPAFTYLAAHGVQVHWAPKAYDVTHQKTITVDGKVSAVMTLNLTRQYYSTSRDFAVIDRAGPDIAAITTVFDNDFAGRSSSPEPAGTDLVWSPGADHKLVSIIGSAHHVLLVENEEMSEYTIVDALVAAAHRGVDVEVVMTYQSSWARNLDKLAQAGAHVRTYAPDAALYIHAKVVDVDPGYPDEQLEVGSQNFSWTSLQYNRELGLDLGPSAGPIIKSVAATVRSDYSGATPWTG